MELIQIIIIIFATFAWSRVVLRYKDEKITVKELIVWSFVLAAAIFLVVWPQTSFVFAKLFGIARGADVIIYLSIPILFYLIFRLYIKIETIEQEITKIVREIAIENRKKKK